MKRIIWLLFIVQILCGLFEVNRAQSFVSVDSALSHIEQLSEVIGPHPAGSQGDSLAQEYISGKMKSYGLEVQVQHVDSLYLRESLAQNFLNTANVIGCKQGRGTKTIVIGAHYDTAGEFVPGANDNSSGVAVLLETARLLSQDTLPCNLMFIAFAAEELGLAGSRYFVEHLPDSVQVACMFNIDMIGQGKLMLGMHPGGIEKWEIDLANKIAQQQNLKRFTFSHFLIGGSRIFNQMYTSDHLPFKEKNIPVFCLGAGLEPFSYHTSSDIIDFVNLQNLKESCELIVSTVRHASHSEDLGSHSTHFLPLRIFNGFWILPAWFLWSVLILSLFIFIVSLVRDFRSGRKDHFAGFIKSLLLIFSTAIPISFWILSGTIVRLLTERRLYWNLHPLAFLLLEIFAFLFGLWISGLLLYRFKESFQQVRLLSWASRFLAIGSILLAIWPGVDFAFYFAVGFLFVSLIAKLPYVSLRLCAWLISILPILFLMSIDDYRTMVIGGDIALPAFAWIILLTVIFHPWWLALLGALRYSGVDWWFHYEFDKIGIVIVLAVLIFGWGMKCYLTPSYNPSHRRMVKVIQIENCKSGFGQVRFSSLEYLKGIATALENADTLDMRKRTWSTNADFKPRVLHTQASVLKTIQHGDSIDILVQTTINSSVPLLKTTLTFKSNVKINAIGAPDSLISKQGLKRTYLGLTNLVRDRVWLRLPVWKKPDGWSSISETLTARLWVIVNATSHRDLFAVEPRANNTVFAHRTFLSDEREVLW